MILTYVTRHAKHYRHFKMLSKCFLLLHLEGVERMSCGTVFYDGDMLTSITVRPVQHVKHQAKHQATCPGILGAKNQQRRLPVSWQATIHGRCIWFSTVGHKLCRPGLQGFQCCRFLTQNRKKHLSDENSGPVVFCTLFNPGLNYLASGFDSVNLDLASLAHKLPWQLGSVSFYPWTEHLPILLTVTNWSHH